MDNEKFKVLSHDSKMVLFAMHCAVTENIDSMSEEKKESLLKQMKEHDDTEEYAVYGYLVATIMMDLIDTMKKEDQEYRIIG